MQSSPHSHAQPAELPKTQEISRAYGTALAQVALAHEGAFSHESLSQDVIARRAEETAQSPHAYISGSRDASGHILAAGAMVVRRSPSTRVATIQQLFRSESAPKGAGRAVLNHLLQAARERKCDHVILSVLKGNPSLISWYRSTGFQVWYTDRSGDVWMRHSLAPINVTDITLDPYTWVEYESYGF